MKIGQKTPPGRCIACRRSKESAIAEQVGKMILCDSRSGGCEFAIQIQEAIQEKQQPQLLKFDISDNRFLEGDNIRVNWKAENSEYVSITQIGNVPSSGTATLTAIPQMREVTIDLVSSFNKTFSHTEKIRVYPRPSLAITRCEDKILTGEHFTFEFQIYNAQSAQLKDANGFIIADLTKVSDYKSEPLNKDTTFTINVSGKYGGEIVKEIPVRVFDPPVINYFKSDVTERVDSELIIFEFDYENAGKAEIFLDKRLIKDVSGQQNYTHHAHNKTFQIVNPTFTLVVTGETGIKTVKELATEINIFPQPAILQTTVKPENVILFPEDIVLEYRTMFCEKVIISNGTKVKTFAPSGSIVDHPKSNTTYHITPVGKNDFRGVITQVNVEVVYPVEIKANVDRQITLPHIPVKVTWQAENCSQIILQPGNHDVTNQDSMEMTLEKRTEIKVWGLNQKDRKSSNVIVDVIPYPKFDPNILGRIPKPEINLPTFKLDFPNFGFEKFRVQPLALEKNENKSIKKTLSFVRNFFKKIDFSFQKLLRREMFNEIKKFKKAKNELL